MKGSEKQIAWAEEIKKVVLDTVEESISTLKNDPRYDEAKHAGAVKTWESTREKVNNAECAWDIIEMFKGCRESDDFKRRASSIVVAIKTNNILGIER